MLTAHESASILWAQIRPHVRCDHSAEIAALYAIVEHIKADRHASTMHVARQSTNLLPAQGIHTPVTPAAAEGGEFSETKRRSNI